MLIVDNLKLLSKFRNTKGNDDVIDLNIDGINNGKEKINILSSRGLFTWISVWRSLERRHDARLRTVDFFFILI
jgi:hypothetical protein